MSLQTLSLLEAATVSATGGTAMPMTSKGGSENKNTLIVDADEDLRTQRSIVLTVRNPKVQATAPNGYTQGRCQALLKFPRTLTNGLISVDTISIQLSTDVETSVADKEEMLYLASQSMFDAETRSAWTLLNVG
jgi:hypothetical protein